VQDKFPQSYTPDQQKWGTLLQLNLFNNDEKAYLVNIASMQKHLVETNGAVYEAKVRAILKSHKSNRPQPLIPNTPLFWSDLTATAIAAKYGASIQFCQTQDEAMDAMASMDTPTYDMKKHITSMYRFIDTALPGFGESNVSAIL
jgi:hypothetical protein